MLIANSNLVPPRWADWDNFNQLDRKGLMMYGQMTAGSWVYIGTQGIIQGTYETFVSIAKKHFSGDASGRWILTGGLGGMGGAQPPGCHLWRVSTCWQWSVMNPELTRESQPDTWITR